MEGKTFGLVYREEVVPVKISKGPYDDKYKECYKACTVVYYLCEGKHYRYPIDNVIGNKDESLRPSQLTRFRAALGFPLPSEPLGAMPFDNRSVNRPDNR